MIIIALEEAFVKIVSSLAAIFSTTFWKERLSIIAFLLSLLTAFPAYDVLFKDKNRMESTWKANLEQVKRPFKKIEGYHPASHEAKLAFRFVPALLAKIFFITDVKGFLILQVVFLFLLFYSITYLIDQTIGDKSITIFVVLAFSQMYVGNSLVVDIWAMTDVITYTFIVLVFLSRSLLGILFFTLLASFCDERAILAIFWAFPYFMLLDSSDFIRKRYFKPLIIAFLLHFLIRLYLVHYFGLETPLAGTGLVVFLEDVGNLPMGVLSGLEGFWLVIVLTLFLIYKNKHYYSLFAALPLIVVQVGISMLVLDITRSMAFIFPAIFYCLLYLKKYEKIPLIQRISCIIFILNFFPTVWVGGQNYNQWLYPLPLHVLRWVMGGEKFSVIF